MVSIVIPVKNGADTIGRVLDSIKSQTYPNIEIIIVDNFSTDGTASECLSRGLTPSLFGPERSSQINHGARLAKGEYLLRHNDDCILPPTIIAEGVSLLETRYDMAEFGWLPDESISFWAKVRHADLSCFIADAKGVGPCFFRTQDFLDMGGNNESLVAGEDYEFSKRVAQKGFRIGLTKSVMTHLGEPKHLREVVRKDVYYGRHLRKSLATGSGKSFSPLRGRYWRHRDNFFRRGPLITFGFALYEMVRYQSALVGMLMEQLA